MPRAPHWLADGARMAKRMFDIVVAAVALLLVAPLLLAAALAVRLDSPGPALFRQDRVGRGGRLFRIHKLRTMRLDAAQRGPGVTVGDDERITRVGRWLRGRRIDELPQFIDVLKGDMSLVGPRPELPRYVARYPAALKTRVLAVRPGMTDPATLDHVDEATWLARSDDPERTYVQDILPAKLAAQAAYAERATLATDIVVLLRTARALLGRRAP
jgi:lipopolysaccharide/colanic/teichoic acid biosynthesis glycosyltransferase